MAVARALASWVLGIVGHFPVAVRPGIFLGLIILLIWGIVRARRPAYNAVLRIGCLLADFTVGLVLLAEFALTRMQRANGGAPGAITLASGLVAEKVLDTAADLYEAHPPVTIKKRPPLILIAVLLIASVVDYWLLHRAPPNSATTVARTVWNYWVQFGKWSRGQ